MIKFVLLVALVASCVNSQATTCPPEDLDYPVYIPDTTYCGKFYECSDGSPIGLECAPGTYYSITKQKCDFNVDCGNRRLSTSPIPTSSVAPTKPN